MNKHLVKNYFSSFLPQSALMLKNYNGSKFLKDLLSGIIVGIIALPLSIALAIASGAPPAIGLVTAAVAGFSAALFAGSPFQVTGPTGAFIIIVLNIINGYTYQGMLIATFMAGIFLVLMGLLKIGKIVNYISKPIIVGFTAGIAVTIFSTQIVDFLSLQLTSNPSEFFEKWIAYFQVMSTTNIASLSIGLGSLILMLLWSKLKIKIPGALIAVLLSSLVVAFCKLNVPTIGTKFGEITMTLQFSNPFGGIDVLSLVKPAITIALLASIESLLSAMAADNMSKTKTNSNTELISQGIANVFSSCFGGLPATGAIARTSANIKSGAVSPVSAMIHAAFILVVGLVLMPLVKFIPLSSLSAVLFMVCKNMIEVKEIKEVFRSNISDMILFTSTFLLTIIFDLVVAICTGVCLSFVLYAMNILIKKINLKSLKLNIVVEDNKIVLSGVLNFLNSNNFMDRIRKIQNASAIDDKELVIDTSALIILDMSGKEALRSLKIYYEIKNNELSLSSDLSKTKQICDNLGIDAA
ncbi:MAG: SulP family inorganic anion transporter [Clostridia bacterium]|nr:SulP family inorganic anion transporter [Clostridia bacterium]